MASRHHLRNGGEAGGGSGTQTFVYQEWPARIFPMVNFVCSHDGHFGLRGGGCPEGGVSRGNPPPLLRWCTAILIRPCVGTGFVATCRGGGGGGGRAVALPRLRDHTEGVGARPCGRSNPEHAASGMPCGTHTTKAGECWGEGRGLMSGWGGGGAGWGRGGVGPQKFVYRKWPDPISPIVNVGCSHNGPFGLGGRGGAVVFHYLNDALGEGERGGRHWSGADPPPSLQPRLPHGLHYSLSSSHVRPATGLACVPNSSRSLPPWLGSGLWVSARARAGGGGRRGAFWRRGFLWGWGGGGCKMGSGVVGE